MNEVLGKFKKLTPYRITKIKGNDNTLQVGNIIWFAANGDLILAGRAGWLSAEDLTEQPLIDFEAEEAEEYLIVSTKYSESLEKR